MSRDVVFVTPTDKIILVAELLFKYGYHGLPVVEQGKVVGIITENDFFIKDAGVLFLPTYINFLKETKVIDDLPAEKRKKIKKLLNLEARDVMTSDPVSVSLLMEATALLELIKKTRYNTLPVTDDENNLLGIVTLVDVVGQIRNECGPRRSSHDVEKLAKEVHSWWRKTFVFIGKAHLRSWKVFLILGFIAGTIATIFWTVRMQTSISASNNMVTLTLRTDDVVVRKGDVFNADLIANTNGQKIMAVATVIKYNPQYFRVEIWDTDGSIFANAGNCSINRRPCQIIEDNPESGELSIFLANPKIGINSDGGKIANVVFRAKQITYQSYSEIKMHPDFSKVYKYSWYWPRIGARNSVLPDMNNIAVQIIPSYQGGDYEYRN